MYFNTTVHVCTILHILSESQLHNLVSSFRNEEVSVVSVYAAWLHELTTMGIDIGIWVLHLAFLQKYRRDSMIASVQAGQSGRITAS